MAKKFNAWIWRNFKVLSAHTLYQFLLEEIGSADYCNNLVYVDLFHVFICEETEAERHTFEAVCDMVECCAWL